MKLVFPPAWLIVVLIPIAVALLVVGLSSKNEGTFIAYVSYLISFYTLVVSIAALPKLIKSLRATFCQNRFICLIKRNKWVRMFIDDITFRGTILIYQGFVANLIYALFRRASAFMYASLWFGSIAIYYTFLCLIKAFLIFCSRKMNKIGGSEQLLYEYRSYRICGALMLLLNSGMALMISLIVQQNQHYTYPGFFIYLSGAYTFYMVISAVINVVKFRKISHPILLAAKAITLVSALMSIMVLQTALISRFGADDVQFRQLANNLTGIAVCLLSFAIAIYMIVHASINIRKLKAMCDAIPSK